MSECLWSPAPASEHNQSFESTTSTTLAGIAFATTTAMQEPTNISIEAGCRQPRNSSSNERLTPSLSRVTIGTPPSRDVLGPNRKEDKTTSKVVDGLPPRTTTTGKVVSPEGRGSIDTHVQTNANSSLSTIDCESTVDSITVPVMRLSIDDAHSRDSGDDDDPDPLTAASFREAYSTAEAVTSFLDQQLRAQHDTYYGGGGGQGPPPEQTSTLVARRPGRMFQRRNSFVIHNRKRSRSLEEGRESSAAGAGTEDAESLAVAAARKPRFETRSQSEGVLLLGGPAAAALHEGQSSPLGLPHRLSLPWKRTKGNSHAASGPSTASSKHS
jgi:hypothetical protein